MNNIYKFTLSNNLPVILIKDNNINSISINFKVRAGSNYEKENQIGAAHLIEHLILSKNRDVITRYGSRVGGITSRDDVSLYIKSMRDYLEESIEYLYTVLQDTAIENLDIHKNIVKQEIKRSLSNPEKLILRRSYKTLYPHTRMAILNTGEEKDIDKITEEQLKTFRKKHYTASNSILVVYGNIDIEKAKKTVTKYMTKLPKGKKVSIKTIQKRDKTNRQIIKIDSEQDHIKVDYYGYTIKDKNKYPLKYLEYIINNLLNEEIRYEKGLAYKVNVFSLSANSYATLSIYVVSSNKNIIKEIDETLNKIKDYIDKIDLAIVKNNIISEFIFRLERPSQVTQFYAENHLFDNPISTDKEIQNYKEVTKKEIFTVYNEIMKQEKKITILKGENNGI